MKKKVLVVGFNFSYHDEYSGYGRLMNYVGDCKVFDYTRIFSDDDYSFAGAVLRRLLIELITIIKGLRVDVVHYIYPEGTVFMSTLILKHVFRKKIVMTFHLAPQWFMTYPASDGPIRRAIRRVFQGLAYRSVRLCDHAISLTSEAVAVYAKAYGIRHISVVPHGIVVDATDAALPAPSSHQRSVCIVGRNYRDWAFVNAVLAQKEARDYAFHLIGVDFEKIHMPEGVRVHAYRERLDHTQYVHALRECLVMFLPLKFATANNAILEAYQHRLFVLTTRAGLNADYQEKSLYEVATPAQFYEIANWIFDGAGGMDMQAVLEETRLSAIRRFGWAGVAEQLQRVYESL